jgi:hypothetical protein
MNKCMFTKENGLQCRAIAKRNGILCVFHDGVALIEKEAKAEQFTIYGLIDPTTSLIRYIGATKDTTKRFKQHLDETEVHGAPEYVQWQTDLRAIGLKPIPVILTLCGASPVQWEQAWIRISEKLYWPIINILRCSDEIHIPQVDEISSEFPK